MRALSTERSTRVRAVTRALQPGPIERQRENFGNFAGGSGVRARLVSSRSPRSRKPAEAPVRRFTHNAFHVLDLSVDASAADVRRAAARLVDRLVSRDPGAARYATPAGPQVRDVAMVQRAAAQLRDPDERVQQEIWATAPTRDEAPQPVIDDGDPGWPAAHTAFGWRRR